jgi:hypothetical protein
LLPPGLSIERIEIGGTEIVAVARSTQVADRWHLMENASSAFLDVVRKSMRSIRQALAAKSARRS